MYVWVVVSQVGDGERAEWAAGQWSAGTLAWLCGHMDAWMVFVTVQG